MSNQKPSFFKRFQEAMKNTPTMKKWGIISWIATICLSTLFVLFIFFGPPNADMRSFATVVGLAWGEVAVYNACYCFKERAENRLKIAYNFIEKMTDKYSLEEMTPII